MSGLQLNRLAKFCVIDPTTSIKSSSFLSMGKDIFKQKLAYVKKYQYFLHYLSVENLESEDIRLSEKILKLIEMIENGRILN